MPTALAKLQWSHNNLLLDKIKDLKARQWYAEKLTNFENKLPAPQSEIARDVIKDKLINIEI